MNPDESLSLPQGQLADLGLITIDTPENSAPVSPEVPLDKSSTCRCYKCKIVKPTDAFAKNQSKCRECRRQYYLEKKSDINHKHALSYKQNKEKRAATNRTWPIRFRNARTAAIRTGRKWELTFYDWLNLVYPSICFYCNGPLNTTGSGLDRLDCGLGYERENVVPCCGECNRIKGDRLTAIEMVVAMDAVLTYRAGK
jgi:5-methylcytosine-specific restriction endonuclease McrA